jgi:adenosylcobyric acid synthase
MGGTVLGTMIHGLFANDVVRASLLRFLRQGKGAPENPVQAWEADYDVLAAAVRSHVDRELLQRIAGVARE